MIKRKTKRSVQKVALYGFIIFSLYTILETQLLAPTREWIGFTMQPKTSIIHAKEEVVSPSPTPDEKYEKLIEVVEEAETNPKEQIKEKIREVFGEDAEIAIAIATAESGLVSDKSNVWGDPNNPKRGECSIGLFQINLKSNGCEGVNVHASKIPGDTLEEKIEWLKVPENNILIAKFIYGSSGWYPWSVYKNGKYKQFLK